MRSRNVASNIVRDVLGYYDRLICCCFLHPMFLAIKEYSNFAFTTVVDDCFYVRFDCFCVGLSVSCSSLV